MSTKQTILKVEITDRKDSAFYDLKITVNGEVRMEGYSITNPVDALDVVKGALKWVW